MNIEEEFASFFDRARSELQQERENARNALNAVNISVGQAQAALDEIQAQHERAKTDLDMVKADVDRLASLASVGHDLEAARQAVAKLTAEKAALETSIAALAKQHDDGQRQVNIVNNEMQRLLNLRRESEQSLAHIRSLFASVQLGALQ